MHRSMQAALVDDFVKTPAHAAPSGASNKAKSARLEDLRSALIAEVWKPIGALTPPGMHDHDESAEGLKILFKG